MSLNFPSSPAAGDTLTAEGRTFIWTGAVWILQAEDIPWASLEEALAGVSMYTFMSPTTMKALIEASEPPPPSYGPLTCRAWCRFTASTGAILAGRNIASIAPGPEGVYAFTFQTPLPSADYLIHTGFRFNDAGAFCGGIRVGVNPTVNGFSAVSAFTGGSGVVGTPRWANATSVAVFL